MNIQENQIITLTGHGIEVNTMLEFYECMYKSHDLVKQYRAYVQDSIDLTYEQYMSFANDLFGSESFIDWKSYLGGASSTSDVDFDDIRDFFKLSKEEQNDWKEKSFSLVVEVKCEGETKCYVNTEGRNRPTYILL